MIDGYFQRPLNRSSSKQPNFGRTFCFRSFFYTSIVGFISGFAFGYLHLLGWIPRAETGLLLYSITLGIAAILSSSFVYYQLRQSQLKVEKIKQKNIIYPK
jgi:hypothetical protein